MKQQYLVAVVGAPESGKSVYLATLGHLLGEARVAPGVTTRIVPAKTEALLQKIYSDIADPAANFPAPTPLGGTLQWDVECGVSARGRNFPLMTISYFDAAGEWVRNPVLGGAESELFFGLIDRLDAVLAFVDGNQLAWYLEGHTSSAVFVKDNIDPILRVANRCTGPVHIVVTKWDLLQSRYSLGAVRAALLDDSKGHLRRLIDDRKSGAGRWLHSPGRIRLIPVTSLGESFAFVNPEGVVQKRPGAEPDPMNVLVPFTAVLPDLCIRAAEAAEADQRAAAATRRLEFRHSPRDFGTLTALDFSIPLAGVAMVVLRGVAGTSRGIAGLVMKGRLPIGVALATLREPALKRVRTDGAAFRYMMKHLVRHLRDFERSFPDSRLV
jgi:hypothetical protein